MSEENIISKMFASNSQMLQGIDPATIRPLNDCVILEDVPDPEQVGLIFIPRNAAERGIGKNGRLRIAIVVAMGPGDKFTEHWRSTFGLQNNKPKTFQDLYRKSLPEGVDRLPMDVSIGDRVIYDRRKECEFFIEGKRYCIVHLEGSVLGVLEPDTMPAT